MRKIKLFLSLLMVMLFSVGNVWAAKADVTYDFTGSGWSVSNGTLSNGTVSFAGNGSDKFQMNTGYFILGKQNAYITFPAYGKAVEKIVVTGRSGASGSTKMNIFVGDNAVSTETTGSTGTNTYAIASANQAAGTIYKLKVTSAHNAQITKIEIFYVAETPGGDPEPGEDSDPTPDPTDDADVTLDLLDAGWNFPTTATTSAQSYTNGGYTLTVSAGFKKNSGYVMVGKSGAYVQLPTLTSPIAKIVVEGNSGGSASTGWNIYQGNTAVSTAATGCTEEAYTFDIPQVKQAANVAHAIKVTSNHNLQMKSIKIYFAAATSKQPAGLSYAEADQNNMTKLGASFTAPTLSNDNGLTVAYASNNTDVAEVNGSTGEITIKTAGKAVITASSDETTQFLPGEAQYTIYVVEHLGTAADPYSVADARRVVDWNYGVSNVFAAGKVSEIVTAYSSQFHNITYNISTDGTKATAQLQAYRGKGMNGDNFTSENDVLVGDEVVVYGNLAKYGQTYEFAENNQLYSRKTKAALSWDGVIANTFAAELNKENTFPTLVNTNSVSPITYSSSNHEVVEEISAAGVPTLKAVGQTIITASFVGDENYLANETSYTLNVSETILTGDISYECNGATSGCPSEGLTDQTNLPENLPVVTKDGYNFGGWYKTTTFETESKVVGGEVITEDVTLYAKWNEPYTVAEARAAIDAGTGVTGVYAKGIVSEIVTEFNPTFGNITYNISADGETTSDQLQAYRGFDKDGDWFESADDVQVGDEVVVYGNLKNYKGLYEFETNNQRYSFKRKAEAELAWSDDAVELTVGDEFTAPTLSNPNNLTVTIASDNTELATVENGVVSLVKNATGTAKISATFAGNDQYKAASVTYSITVNASETPVDTRKVANSPATFTTTNGNLDPADIAYASYQGGASTAPAIYNDGIRLYQIGGSNDFGGFVTLTAKAGCTIDEVQITTTSKYATTVAYSVDGNENLLKSESVAASSSYTTGTGLNVSSVNILNVGTGSSGRLEIASIKVYYTGEAATIDHYELGGTYQTAFMQDEEFNHTGLIVYAVYDALGENKVDITSMCTFSEPDMSTTGEKTIEITYNEAVVISYTINVAADSRKVAESPVTFTTVSGDMTPNDITFASNQGEAGTAPANYNDGIRLYQAPSADKIGGYITLKAKKGCTIDQVKITTTNSYATTVAYSVDGNENLLGSESVAKSSDYSTPSGLNVESVNIVNKGTGSSGRLEIASIKVWYTGDALAVDHYILGGTYATEFEQYGEFNYEGLTVTAAYDAGETITEAVTGFTVEADLSTAGEKKAEVMLNSVKIAEYDITVTASTKEDPALSYNPASVILTLGDALSAPTFSNTHNVSPITYESSKPAVATVDAEGNITLAGGTGVAVITASFAGDDGYIESEATFTITVNEPTEDLSGTWVKATSVAAGDRIIIGATVTAGTKTMGLQNTNNRAAVASTLDEYGVLTPAEGTKTFLVVDAGDGKFALQALNGKYLTSATSGTGNNLLEAANYENDNAKWTITIDGEGVASVVAAAGNRTYMKYNNGSTLFSCYQYETSQSPINIYKIGTPDYGSYQRDGLTPGNYATICLPNGGTIANAKLFDLEYFNEAASTLYLLEVNGNAMVAGRPYIFLPSATTIEVTYTDNAGANAGSYNGLVGSYTEETVAIGTGDEANYILWQNAYYLVNSAAKVGANRAYIHMAGVPTEPSTPQAGQAPRRRVGMTVHGEQTTTDIDALNAAEAPVKVMINGQMYILRGEKMYDATGRLVK